MFIHKIFSRRKLLASAAAVAATGSMLATSRVAFAETVDAAALTACLDEGYLDWTPEGWLRATEEGRLRLDALLPVLLR